MIKAALALVAFLSFMILCICMAAKHSYFEIKDTRTNKTVASFKTHWEAEQYIDEHPDDTVYIED